MEYADVMLHFLVAFIDILNIFFHIRAFKLESTMKKYYLSKKKKRKEKRKKKNKRKERKKKKRKKSYIRHVKPFTPWKAFVITNLTKIEKPLG